MSEPAVLTLISVVITVASVLVAEKVSARRLEETVCQIVQELEKEEAFDPFTAVELPAARIGFQLMFGRSSRPQALEMLTRRYVVRRTGAGKLYLKLRLNDDRVRRMAGACAPAR
ncbi:MAG: hypothetical protein MUC33_07165 [Desulfobacterales bacterium]|jgi:hypothetical protein|nr:hypothetical protein [Desulfobacterales bacterium]